MIKEIICIKCPLGCRMSVELEGDVIADVQGYQCKQGKKHAQKEVFFPGRILTTTIKTDLPDFPLLPVRSSEEIPKEKLLFCMDEISKHIVKGEVEIGAPVIKDILGLGVDMVACRTIPCLPYECPLF